jgi:hypothetical protein
MIRTGLLAAAMAGAVCLVLAVGLVRAAAGFAHDVPREEWIEGLRRGDL